MTILATSVLVSLAAALGAISAAIMPLSPVRLEDDCEGCLTNLTVTAEKKIGTGAWAPIVPWGEISYTSGWPQLYPGTCDCLPEDPESEESAITCQVLPNYSCSILVRFGLNTPGNYLTYSTKQGGGAWQGPGDLPGDNLYFASYSGRGSGRVDGFQFHSLAAEMRVWFDMSCTACAGTCDQPPIE